MSKSLDLFCNLVKLYFVMREWEEGSIYSFRWIMDFSEVGQIIVINLNLWCGKEIYKIMKLSIRGYYYNIVIGIEKIRIKLLGLDIYK